MTELHTVTAFYTIKSKHSVSEYENWIERFFRTSQSTITCFYDSTESRDLLLRNGADRSSVELVQLAIDHFWTSSLPIDWERQHSLDRERTIHSIDLYKVWLEKTAFVCRVAQTSQARFLLWRDIGQVRSRAEEAATSRWNLELIRDRLERSARINVVQLQKFDWDARSITMAEAFVDLNHMNFAAGANLWGVREAWAPWRTALEETAVDAHDAGFFMAKDQILYSYLLATRNDLVMGRPTPRIRKGQDKWFSLGRVLSQRREPGELPNN